MPVKSKQQLNESNGFGKTENRYITWNDSPAKVTLTPTPRE